MKRFYSICLLILLNAVTAFSQSHFANLQFAGSTGMITAGAFKQIISEKFHAGLQYGYTPQKENDLHTISLKLIYSPFNFQKEKYGIIPLETGIFISQHFGKPLHFFWPEYYPDNYYWWPASLRSHFFIGTSAFIKTNSKFPQKLSIYLGANTNDLYIASYIANKNHTILSPFDIFFLGTGIRAWF